MATVEVRNSITPSELAHLGEGTVAYVREMESEDLKGKFPGLPEIAPGTRLWALFAANGQPIPAAVARPRYSRTVLGAMPSSRPIARVLAPAPKCIVSNCLIRRMDSLCVGIPPLHRLRWRHWTPGHC